ncbi:MAG: galactosyldiacylglycerol synthase, partial [Candidatus Omnitrophica bacterium]|nr:galactosyldiacylglycerol synthase [Candidatus Omnitrophota bacterium]
CRMVHGVLGSQTEIQAIVVAGNNADLKARIDRLADSDRILSLGFVDDMDLLMDAADIVVGKAGGLTVSESLAKKKPLFIVNPVPGQEEFNTRILSRAGAAVWVRDLSALDGMISQYMNDSARRAQIQRAILDYSHPDAARQIAADLIQ